MVGPHETIKHSHVGRSNEQVHESRIGFSEGLLDHSDDLGKRNNFA